jgi:hypothetical protein
MAHDLQQLLVRPNVVFERCNVEIADEDRRDSVFDRPDIRHFRDKAKLVVEFRVDRRIGFIPSGRDIEIVETEFSASGSEDNADVTAVAYAAKIKRNRFFDGTTRKDRNAVIALLAMDGLMLVAEFAECLSRKLVILALDLLKAENFRLMMPDEILYQSLPQPNRIDVPGSYLYWHGPALLR